MLTRAGILSLTTPGVPIVGPGEEGRGLAREVNEWFAETTKNGTRGNDRLGFFGALPDWRDVEGTIAEIDYLYETQKLAHGVIVSSSYGDKLLGDDAFKPIWKRLNEKKALIFLHPTAIPGVEPERIAGGLPSPIVDFPLATTRAAVDLVLTGRMSEIPDVDIILSHAGGTLPYIGSRVVGSLVIPDVAETVPVGPIEANREFQRFFLDIALSTSAAQLNGLLDWTKPEKILFGTDFPYAAQFAITALTAQYETFVATNPRGENINDEVLRENALALLAKHEQGKKFRKDMIQQPPEVKENKSKRAHL